VEIHILASYLNEEGEKTKETSRYERSLLGTGARCRQRLNSFGRRWEAAPKEAIRQTNKPYTQDVAYFENSGDAELLRKSFKAKSQHFSMWFWRYAAKYPP